MVGGYGWSIIARPFLLDDGPLPNNSIHSIPTDWQRQQFSTHNVCMHSMLFVVFALDIIFVLLARFIPLLSARSAMEQTFHVPHSHSTTTKSKFFIVTFFIVFPLFSPKCQLPLLPTFPHIQLGHIIVQHIHYTYMYVSSSTRTQATNQPSFYSIHSHNIEEQINSD